MCRNFFLRPQAGNFVRLFAGRLRLNPARRKNFFCGYKFNHKNFFAGIFEPQRNNFFQCGKVARRQVKIYYDNKIAVPLSVFVSGSLIYTLGT